MKIKSFWATNLCGNDHCCCLKIIYNWNFARKRANANSVSCFRSCLNNMYTWVKPLKIMYLNTSSRHPLNGFEMNEIRFTSGHWTTMYKQLPIQHHYHLLPHSMCLLILQTYYGAYSSLRFQGKEKEFQECCRVNFCK